MSSPHPCKFRFTPVGYGLHTPLPGRFTLQIYPLPPSSQPPQTFVICCQLPGEELAVAGDIDQSISRSQLVLSQSTRFRHENPTCVNRTEG
eukprot:368394-Prorocentrum_minimum.AAC.3